MDMVFDIIVIGGGINGCGIAADAAMRGLSVLLIEKDDIASKTSSSSSKLIHGGLRYLEQYNFSLVKKALDERQVLLKIAPHLVYPLPFVLPYDQSMRPTWLLRTGLFLYDHLSRKNRLPKSRFIRRASHADRFSPLTRHYQKGFLFYDCATDDARLTVTNALQAKRHGATILSGTELLHGIARHNQWHITARQPDGEEKLFRSKVIINASGPWVEQVNQRLQVPSRFKISLVKGSHLVVHKLYEGNHAYLLQNQDNRIVFVIPYHGFTMIGTTDIAIDSSPDNIAISPQEIEYLLSLTNRYLNRPLKPQDIITTWSGVRPLLSSDKKTPQALSRDYTYHFIASPAPIISIYGGKITTYRQLSRETIDALAPVFPSLKPSGSHREILPGGHLGELDFKSYLSYAKEKYHWLENDVKERILHTYGTLSEQFLAKCDKTSDLGIHFGHGLYQSEVDYLINEEWAHSCDDILWRRTKLGLFFNPPETQGLSEYLRHSLKQETVEAP
ncbi:glycerol-3-phosphate dehydrogenase [Legionella spiritensis]|uniref:Glycerol-3-phosphate dehydrogenase n=1 Tax=Legionella spiritensis TaxID=452 RepID=A0A0W0Z5G1_LEGSP|nr:glycerol-3-phosphate dehydrogenase [Legionella spiritensis]KTD63958.1 glycerol-3-phosphate dehydrogenase [Legionella spiritensis]SNV36835.1 glycerol-3-phosphate dehydrogenase [Legionella spiritensis]